MKNWITFLNIAVDLLDRGEKMGAALIGDARARGYQAAITDAATRAAKAALDAPTPPATTK